MQAILTGVADRWVGLFCHGDEPREKLIELDEAQLAVALESLVTRIAVLQVHAVQVWAAKLRLEVGR